MNNVMLVHSMNNVIVNGCLRRLCNGPVVLQIKCVKCQVSFRFKSFQLEIQLDIRFDRKA